MPRTQPDAPACRSAGRIGPGKRRTGARAPVRLTMKINPLCRVAAPVNGFGHTVSPIVGPFSTPSLIIYVAQVVVGHVNHSASILIHFQTAIPRNASIIRTSVATLT